MERHADVGAVLDGVADDQHALTGLNVALQGFQRLDVIDVQDNVRHVVSPSRAVGVPS